MRKVCVRAFALFLILGLLPWSYAFARGDASDSFCNTLVRRVCSVDVHLPSLGLGQTAGVEMPEQFENRQLMVQCVHDGGRTYFRFLNGGDSLCALRKCEKLGVPLCGRLVPVDGAVPVGETVRASLPSEMMAGSFVGSSSHVLARCVVREGGLQYEVADMKGFSCNSMACLPSTLSVCGAQINIGETAAAGEVRSLTSPAGHHVTVQCLASGGRAPEFVVVGHVCKP